MSRNIKNSAPIKKYCKVCQDAGKSEAEYRSHFTRESSDPKSKVKCPTLLAMECRFCYKYGHTVKYCPTIKDNEKHRKRNDAIARRNESIKTEVKSEGKSHNNLYSCFETDSEEEEIIKEEFPTLLSSSLTSSQFISTSYAAALSKPVIKIPEVKSEEASLVPIVKSEIKSTKWVYGVKTDLKMRSWADWSDSEDEEEVVYPSVAA